MINELTSTEARQEEIIKTIENNKSWIRSTHEYLMRDVDTNSYRMEKQGGMEVRVPCIVKTASAYKQDSKPGRAASMWTRTLDHFDKQFELSEENEDRVLEIVKQIINK